MIKKLDFPSNRCMCDGSAKPYLLTVVLSGRETLGG